MHCQPIIIVSLAYGVIMMGPRGLYPKVNADGSGGGNTLP